jgi:hypothetical protein
MRRAMMFRLALLAAVLSLGLLVCQVDAAQTAHQMTGKITAIDSGANTVVVDVPVHGKMLTVGGPLSQKAVLKKGGKSVGLNDFSVGDKVTVKWMTTGNGPMIEGLHAK